MSSARRPTLDRAEYGARLVAVALLAPTLLLAFLWLEPADGAFDFSVAERLLGGEQLYRDMEFFSTPLSVYWNALLLRLISRSMVTVSAALLVSCLLIGLILSRLVYRETERSWPITGLFFLTLMYMAVHHWPRHGYSWNAALFVALAVVLLNPPPRIDNGAYETPLTRLFWAGAMLGMATGFKHTIGLSMTAAAAMWIIYTEWVRADRSAVRLIVRGSLFTIGAALVPTVIMLDLYRRGQFARFVEVVSVRSRQYAQGVSSSFLENFGLPNSVWSVPNWVLEQVMLMLMVAGLFISVFLILGLLFSATRPRKAGGWLAIESRAPVVMLWAMVYLASFVSMFPRADYPHLTFAMPSCLTALCVFARPMIVGNNDGAPRTLRRIAAVVCLALSIPMAAKLGYMAFGLATGQFVVFSTYPARGMITTPQMAAMFSGIRGAVRDSLADGDPLLIADPTGCFLYSFLGRRPPTSSVYFYERMVTDGDQTELVRQIESGRIRGLLIPAPASAATGRLARLYADAARTMEFRGAVRNFHLFVGR
jgi:hypothetical protein